MTCLVDRIIEARIHHAMCRQVGGVETGMSQKMVAYNAVRGKLFAIVGLLDSKSFCSDSHVRELCEVRAALRAITDQVSLACA